MGVSLQGGLLPVDLDWGSLTDHYHSHSNPPYNNNNTTTEKIFFLSLPMRERGPRGAWGKLSPQAPEIRDFFFFLHVAFCVKQNLRKLDFSLGLQVDAIRSEQFVQ